MHSTSTKIVYSLLVLYKDIFQNPPHFWVESPVQTLEHSDSATFAYSFNCEPQKHSLAF